MPRLNAWATEDRRILLSLSDEVLEVLQQHRQTALGLPESGGLLLGYVRGPNLQIVEATKPTKFDKRLRFLFERMPYGHQLLAEMKWAASSGTLRYLGEWHTHPEARPTPSCLDKQEWKKLAEKRLDERPLLAVIVGTDGMHVQLTSARGDETMLWPIEKY